uniref:G protein-coupled receptor 135 n=1 Tax=Anas platyrhynchos TaxID=8839 RepID=A0A8B9SND2_ANAPL
MGPGNGLKLCHGRLRWEMRRHFCSESRQALGRVAQGGGGVTVPGGVQGKVGPGPLAAVAEPGNLSRGGGNDSGEAAAASGAGWSAAALASQALALLLIFALSALGNGAVVLVIARHRQLRTVTNAFVLSLSLSELLGALLCLPLAFLSLLSRPPGAWLFGQRLCLASAALHAGLGIAATLTMALLSFDRYCAIVRQPRHKMGRRRAAQLLAAVWLAALALAWPLARPGAYRCVYVLPWGSSRLGPPYGAALIVLCYLLPFALMCFCHYNICRAVRLAESRVRPLTTYGHLLPRPRAAPRPPPAQQVGERWPCGPARTQPSSSVGMGSQTPVSEATMQAKADTVDTSL